MALPAMDARLERRVRRRGPAAARSPTRATVRLVAHRRWPSVGAHPPLPRRRNPGERGDDGTARRDAARWPLSPLLANVAARRGEQGASRSRGGNVPEGRSPSREPILPPTCSGVCSLRARARAFSAPRRCPSRVATRPHARRQRPRRAAHRKPRRPRSRSPSRARAASRCSPSASAPSSPSDRWPSPSGPRWRGSWGAGS